MTKERQLFGFRMTKKYQSADLWQLYRLCPVCRREGKGNSFTSMLSLTKCPFSLSTKNWLNESIGYEYE